MELCYDGALVMPSNFVPVESDEMEYIGGGWSASVLENNVIGLLGKGGSRALSVISWGMVSAMAEYTYAAACVQFGYRIVSVVSMVGGIIAGVIAALAVTAAVLYLGDNRVFY